VSSSSAGIFIDWKMITSKRHVCKSGTQRAGLRYREGELQKVENQIGLRSQWQHVVPLLPLLLRDDVFLEYARKLSVETRLFHRLARGLRL